MNSGWEGECNGSDSCNPRPLTTASLALALLLGAAAAFAQPVPIVHDTPDDWGTSLTVEWKKPDDNVTGYEIWRYEAQEGAPADTLAFYAGMSLADFVRMHVWRKVAEPRADDTLYVDTGLSHEKQYQYALAATTPEGRLAFRSSSPSVPTRQWIKGGIYSILIAVILFTVVVVFLVQQARRGARLFIRRISGLEAVEEAVGRATEMGRPIMYIPGLDPMDEVATVAAIDILGQVAKKAGEYETKLVVPNRDPIVMTVAQQVVRESYSAVGKPHFYREEDVFYVTYSQFGFAAAVAGLMMREKPATNFFIGHFYAESLVLAETGNATGAIQIAGTDSDAQLPFFISACDYTLIGEELYAGSVYLSRQPLLLGALKAQDFAKAAIIAVMVIGILLSVVNPQAAEVFRSLFR